MISLSFLLEITLTELLQRKKYLSEDSYWKKYRLDEKFYYRVLSWIKIACLFQKCIICLCLVELDYKNCFMHLLYALFLHDYFSYFVAQWHWTVFMVNKPNLFNLYSVTLYNTKISSVSLSCWSEALKPFGHSDISLLEGKLSGFCPTQIYTSM